LYNQIFFVALGLMVLLGTVRFLVLLAGGCRKGLRQRLAAISTASQPDEEPATPLVLRRALPQRRLRGFYRPPAELWARLDAALAAAGNRIGLTHLIAIGLVAATTTIGFAIAVTQLPPALAAALGVAAALAGPALLLRFVQRRYQRRFLDLFPDALDLIVRAARAGLPALEAIEVAAREIPRPVGTEFLRMLDEMRIGVEMEDALQHAADRIRAPDFRFFVVSLVLQRRTGGGLADTLSNLSTVIRQRKALRRKVHALTAEPKTSVIVVAIMPIVAAVGMSFINREMISDLFVDPRGRFMLGVAVVSLLLGIVLMNLMIKKSMR
jgi:tight adherence protein B